MTPSSDPGKRLCDCTGMNGCSAHQNDSKPSSSAFRAMARKAEELGFESFWCAEHPFIPVQSQSRFPGSEDGVIPETYSHFIDPFVALARASGTTSRIKLGTGIVLVPERHPLLLAKEISTLDLFSGGRFLFGIGAGWLREETQLMGG